MIVMGAVVGSGIFMTPSVVAQRLHSGWLVMLAWTVGGIIGMLGAFLFAELAERRPQDGGFYAYLRDAFHPVFAFSYGWTLLLASQSGSIAAAAVMFANYLVPLTGIHLDLRLPAAIVIAFFTIINLFGVREGTSTQNALMILKIVMIAGFVALGVIGPHGPGAAAPIAAPLTWSVPLVFGFALVPVLFSYNGYQTATFMSGEMHQPERSLPHGLILGMSLVVALYLGVNVACLGTLGVAGLAGTSTPATAVAQTTLGPIGARVMAGVIMLSALGLIGNSILTTPRIFFQMAKDGVFFKSLAWIDPRRRVPAVAIALQGAVAVVIALSGRFDQILDYVAIVDFVFFGFAAIALFVFRARDRSDGVRRARSTMPGHPWTTLLYLAVSWGLVADLVFSAPHDSLIGVAILLSSVPVYALFTLRQRKAAAMQATSASPTLRS